MGVGNGQLVRLRGVSALRKGRVGYLTPEQTVEFRSVAAPGAVSAVLFEAEAAGKFVRGRERHTTAGSGSSVVKIHRHAAGHVGAPSEAVTTGVVLVASAPADSTVNTIQSITFVAGEEDFAAGDQFMLVMPATYAGVLVQLTYVYTGRPVGADA